MAGTITVKPGETLQVVGVPADTVLPPYIPGPADPGYSPPWAQVPPQRPVAGWPVVPGWGGSLPGGGGFPGQGGPVDPGYSPPWAQVPPGTMPGGPRPSHPIALPGDPWWGGGGPVDPGYSPPWAQVPIEPPTEPPPVTPPTDSGNWVWAWSPQLNRWVWVKVPGEGEAGPK
jgi:hypothetical protein